MRIRYWSADVCSSDLAAVAKVADAEQQQGLLEAIPIQQAERRGPVPLESPAVRVVRSSGREIQLASAAPSRATARPAITVMHTRRRPEERRGGHGCVRQGRSRWDAVP